MCRVINLSMDVQRKRDEIKNIYDELVGSKGGVLFGGLWSDNSVLDAKMKSLSGMTESLKRAVTKCSLIRSQPLSPDLMGVYIELEMEMSALVSLFKDVCERGSPSSILLTRLFGGLDTLFSRIHDLMAKIDEERSSVFKVEGVSCPTGDSTAAAATGVVWGACDALCKVPKSNKAAFRWTILQSMISIRETMKEFQEYVDDAEQEGKGDDGDSDDDNDDDNDEEEEEEEPYTAEECASVREVLSLFATVVDHVKVVLGNLTSAADEDGAGNSVAGQGVIAQAVGLVTEVDKSVVDLASELYAPFDYTIIAAKTSALQAKLDVLAEMPAQLQSS